MRLLVKLGAQRPAKSMKITSNNIAGIVNREKIITRVLISSRFKEDIPNSFPGVMMTRVSSVTGLTRAIPIEL